MHDIAYILISSSVAVICVFGYLFLNNKNSDINKNLIIIQERLQQVDSQRERIQTLLNKQQEHLFEQRKEFDQYQIKSLKLIQDSLQKASEESRNQVTIALKQHSESLSKELDKLTQTTQKRLQDISAEVDKRLNAGFEKTTATFTDVVKRLTIIDQAQKKISELSGNVVSLQEILSDKKSRGAFGEVQLNNLINNMIPENHFAFQHTLSNQKRADCILFLPEPTGNMVIDAKFPLEYFRIMTDENSTETARKDAEKQFKVVIRKHIQDIADKYIIPGETSDGAMMFIPAEAIFAEIHAHYADLVEFAQQKRVWLVSPTTMMAILTTVRAVLKDAATRKQVHIIQEHLVNLSKDFSRFQSRMDSLNKHISQAHQDVENVHKSSQKITSRFNKIEKVELEAQEKLEHEQVLPT